MRDTGRGELLNRDRRDEVSDQRRFRHRRPASQSDDKSGSHAIARAGWIDRAGNFDSRHKDWLWVADHNASLAQRDADRGIRLDTQRGESGLQPFELNAFIW